MSHFKQNLWYRKCYRQVQIVRTIELRLPVILVSEHSALNFFLQRATDELGTLGIAIKTVKK
jgi:hypothetical protein